MFCNVLLNVLFDVIHYSIFQSKIKVGIQPNFHISLCSHCTKADVTKIIFAIFYLIYERFCANCSLYSVSFKKSYLLFGKLAVLSPIE